MLIEKIFKLCNKYLFIFFNDVVTKNYKEQILYVKYYIDIVSYYQNLRFSLNW